MVPYSPARWLPGPHAMTVYARLARPLPRPRARRERVELPDGDFVDVDRFDAPEPDAPVLVVCHGLEGSSRTPYVRGVVAQALARGLGAAALNFRGCSGEPNRLPRFYHSGETEDLAALVARLAAERPGRPLLLCGFSLGGNVVAKWMGDRGAALPAEVRAGAVISVPFDLDRCCGAIDGAGAMVAVYRARFLRTLRAKALAKAARFPRAIDAAAVRAARTIRGFDAAVTAPLHGFASAEDYYARASSGPGLGRVARPLLAISALDDPMVPRDALPLDLARANPRVALETPLRGGHVGFVAGAPWRPRFWAERRAVEFLASHTARDAAGV
jgi:predicted alpha/beta-fold hydrolase